MFRQGKRVLAAWIGLALGTSLVFTAGTGQAATVTIKSGADIKKYMVCKDDVYYVKGTNNVLNVRLGDMGSSYFFTLAACPESGGSGHTVNVYSGGGKYIEIMAGTISNNKVVMTNGTVYDVYGALNKGSNTVSNNSVTISGGTVNGQIYGGYSGYGGTGGATNNTVTISGGTISNMSIYGGNGQGLANNNTVTVTGGNFSGNSGILWGGYCSYSSGTATNSEATGNVIKVSGFSGTMTQVIGGTATNNKDTALASKNQVILGSGTYKGSVEGGSTSGSSGTASIADSNSVQINGGTHQERIYGGSATISSEGTATASNNSVEVNAGELSGFQIYGGYASGGTNAARGNQVIINGGTMNSTASIITGGFANNGTAENNKVVLNGGTVAGSIYAGDAEYSGTERNNSIDIYAKSALDLSKATLYGTKWRYSDVSSINSTLNVYTKDITVKDVKYFSNLNYYLPTNVRNGDTIITVNSTMSTDLGSGKVSVYVPGGTSLGYGDKVNLLTNTRRIWWDGNVGTATLTEGVSIEYPVAIQLENGDTSLVATIGGTLDSGLDGAGSNENTAVQLKEQTESLVETVSAGMAALNSSADFVTSKGLAAAQVAAGTSAGFNPFFAAGGSNMRYKTGSHVDSDGFGLALGLAKEIKGTRHTLLTGPFAEYGGSTYDSYLDDGTHAKGNTHFFGGGWFLQNELKNGFFYDGSLRLGRLTSDYHGEGAMATNYDSRSNYYGLHAGVGNRWPVGKKDNVSLYGKYFYTHQAGDDVTLSTGEKYNFKAINSSRTRLGVRYTHKTSADTEIYGGLAWDYEFSAKGRASYRGLSTPATSMKGSSGMAELGVKFVPSEKDPLTMDISLQGWTGKQRGLAANATLLWKF